MDMTLQPLCYSSRRSPAEARGSSDLSDAIQEWGGDCDPLDADEVGDAGRLLTERQLRRLALLAATAGARSASDPAFGDALDWMTSGRRMFDGRRPIDAALDPEHLRRGLLMLELERACDAEQPISRTLTFANASLTEVVDRSRVAEVDLYTCEVGSGSGPIEAFCVAAGTGPEDLRRRVADRYGAEAARRARIRTGLDATRAMSAGLLSVAQADALAEVASSPGYGLRDLFVAFEREFAS